MTSYTRESTQQKGGNERESFVGFPNFTKSERQRKKLTTRYEAAVFIRQNSFGWLAKKKIVWVVGMKILIMFNCRKEKSFFLYLAHFGW